MENVMKKVDSHACVLSVWIVVAATTAALGCDGEPDEMVDPSIASPAEELTEEARSAVTTDGPIPACKVSCTACKPQINAAFDAKRAQYPWLGNPTTGMGGLGGCAYFQHFGGGGSIYFHPDTGTHVVYGAIRAKWESVGWERSSLGFPTTDELAIVDAAQTRYSKFQGGVIYWTPAQGAMMLQGAIHTKWIVTGGQHGFLGLPLTDELKTPDAVGRFVHFRKGGSIYWSPSTGAQEIRGTYKDRWAALGWEQSWLGYPNADDATSFNVPYKRFQNGYIFNSPAYGLAEGRYWFAGQYVYMDPWVTDDRAQMQLINTQAAIRGTVPSFRTNLLEIGLLEASTGWSGNAARSRYNAEGEWCTEFARWVFLRAGMKLSICGVTNSCPIFGSLATVTTVEQIVNLFQSTGRWRAPATPALIEPGDYLALTGSDGKKSHSGIAVAISPDHRWIWTVEGNVDDKVQYRGRDLIVDGVMNPDIHGVGKLDASLF
jgi:hypothetical protein